MIVTLVSWIGVVLVLGTYALCTHTPSKRNLLMFAVANAGCSVPVALPAILAGAWSSAAISLTFGALGLYALITHRFKR